MASIFEDAGQSIVYVGGDVLEHTVILVARDLVATLGWPFERADAIVRPEAEAHARIDREGDDLGVEFALAVAEATQQALHDTLEDITWPACPGHGRHPLWLAREETELPTWRCPADGTSYGPLGQLVPTGSAAREDVVRLIAADLAATTPWSSDEAEDFVRRHGGGWCAGDQAVLLATEEVQQRLHDDRIDTSWPACPDHPHHPLRLSDRLPAVWICPSTEAVVCAVGDLTSVYRRD